MRAKKIIPHRSINESDIIIPTRRRKVAAQTYTLPLIKVLQFMALCVVLAAGAHFLAKIC